MPPARRTPVVLQNPGASLNTKFATLSFSTSKSGPLPKTLVTVDVLGLVKARLNPNLVTWVEVASPHEKRSIPHAKELRRSCGARVNP